MIISPVLFKFKQVENIQWNGRDGEIYRKNPMPISRHRKSLDKILRSQHLHRMEHVN